MHELGGSRGGCFVGRDQESHPGGRPLAPLTEDLPQAAGPRDVYVVGQGCEDTFCHC